MCSSRSKSLGVVIVAIKSAIAWRCPPDNNPISLSNLSSSPKSKVASNSLKSFLSSLVVPGLKPLTLPRRSAKDIFCATVIRGAVPSSGFWKTLLINPALLCSTILLTSFPSIKISPPSSENEPAKALRKVDFPAPFPPRIVIKSPSFISRLTFFKACCSLIVPGKNVLSILLIFINDIFYASFLLAFNFNWGRVKNIAITKAETNLKSLAPIIFNFNTPTSSNL